MQAVTKLTKSVDDLLNSKEEGAYNLLCNGVRESVLDFYTETSNNPNFFITSLRLKFFKPISSYLGSYKLVVQGGIRMLIGHNNEYGLIDKLLLIENLKEDILEDYSAELQSTIDHNKYLTEGLASDRNVLVQNYTNDEHCITILPLKRFKLEVQKKSDNVAKYFDDCLELKDERYKDRLSKYVYKVREQIDNIQSCIDDQEGVIEDLIKKEPEFQGEWKPALETGYIGDPIDLKDHFKEVLKNNQDELEKFKFHKQTLENLLRYFIQSNLFLVIQEARKEKPKYVFDIDTKVLGFFYEEFRFFLEPKIKLEDFIEVFTLGNEPTNKINLVHGTVNDYAYLMNEMQPHFIETIGNKKNYNTWWADRFKFNGKEKNKDQVSTIRSNTKRRGDRKAQYTIQIGTIVSLLS